MENLTTTTPMILCLDADHFSLPLDPVQPADMEGLGYNLHSSNKLLFVYECPSEQRRCLFTGEDGGSFINQCA